MALHQLKPNEVASEVIKLLASDLVPFITGAPGIAKSAMIHQIQQQHKLQLIDLRLSQATPEDFMGLPMRDGDRAKFVPFRTFPLEGDPIPPGMNGWLLFLDEANSSNRAVQVAAYKLVWDRMVDQAKLHENCYIVMAGNQETDGAITTPMSTALQSRVVHLTMVPDIDGFRANAIKKNFDMRMLAFLEFKEEALHQFDPQHNDKTFACPRTWEFVSKYITGRSYEEIHPATLCGTVGEGLGTEFYTFLAEFSNLSSYKDVLTNGENIPIPENASTRYAMCMMILEKIDPKDMQEVFKYISRMPAEFQAVFMRRFRTKFPKLRNDATFQKANNQLAKFFTDDSDEDLAA